MIFSMRSCMPLPFWVKPRSCKSGEKLRRSPSDSSSWGRTCKILPCFSLHLGLSTLALHTFPQKAMSFFRFLAGAPRDPQELQRIPKTLQRNQMNPQGSQSDHKVFPKGAKSAQRKPERPRIYFPTPGEPQKAAVIVDGIN